MNRREPAVIVCTSCGRREDAQRATEADRHLQRLMDLALRPRSAECSR